MFLILNVESYNSFQTFLLNYYKKLIFLTETILEIRKNLNLTNKEKTLYLHILKFTELYQRHFNIILSLEELLNEINNLRKITVKQCFQKFNKDISVIDKYFYLCNFFDKINREHILLLISKIRSLQNCKLMKYIDSDNLIFNQFYFQDLLNIYKNVHFLLSNDTRKNIIKERYYCGFFKNNIPIMSLIVNKDTENTQEHVFIHHNIFDKIYNNNNFTDSLELHKMANKKLKNKYIYCDPLPIMMKIIQKGKREGKLEYFEINNYESKFYKFKPTVKIVIL